jgi:predicted N-formylglutamate amidohydrolase
VDIGPESCPRKRTPVTPDSLFEPDEPAVFEVIDDRSNSPFLITCDHAGRHLPRSLGSLGLPESELLRHIAWDIGASGVARFLAAELGAFAILQTYSRLVIDCNRPLGVPTSIVAISEDTVIPGNRDIGHDEAERRARAVFTPYHERIRRELKRRTRTQQPTALVAMHSFTPTFRGVARPWHVGVLYNRDARLAHALLALLRGDPALEVGDNEPYAVSDATDYGVVEHGERRGIPYVEVEIRQDLLSDEAGQVAWARRLAELLPEALATFDATSFKRSDDAG